MKKKLVLLLVLFVSTSAFAQLSKYSVGVVGTHFHNESTDNSISNADNPYGYGLIVTRNINDQFSVALTGEYFNDDIEKIAAKEKAYRLHLSGIMHTLETKFVQPYFTGGIILTNRTIEYSENGRSDDTDNLLNGRLSIGANIPVYANLFLNGDLAMYTDGFSYVGWATTIGFRVGL